MSKTSVMNEKKIYESLYGDIPNDLDERVKYILGSKYGNGDYERMISKEINKMRRIKKIKSKFTLWKLPIPSRRPRTNTTMGYVRMYVPNAKENGEWFEEYLKENELPYIDTPCVLNMKIFEQTPRSFSKKNKVLAELGYIRPWKRTGDFDNHAKSVSDSIQHGMLADDCLIIDSRIELYYSIKPHIDIEIIYLEKFPEY